MEYKDGMITSGDAPTEGDIFGHCLSQLYQNANRFTSTSSEIASYGAARLCYTLTTAKRLRHAKSPSNIPHKASLPCHFRTATNRTVWILLSRHHIKVTVPQVCNE